METRKISEWSGWTHVVRKIFSMPAFIKRSDLTWLVQGEARVPFMPKHHAIETYQLGTKWKCEQSSPHTSQCDSDTLAHVTETHHNVAGVLWARGWTGAHQEAYAEWLRETHGAVWGRGLRQDIPPVQVGRTCLNRVVPGKQAHQHHPVPGYHAWQQCPHPHPGVHLPAGTGWDRLMNRLRINVFLAEIKSQIHVTHVCYSTHCLLPFLLFPAIY